jgi:hypothetical protein
VQRARPFACRPAKQVERDPTLVSREVPQAAQARFEQGARAAEIAALIVVKCRGNLNDSLKKSLLRFSRSEPNFFPDFVGLEETLGVELFEPSPESLSLFCIHQIWVLFSGISAKTDLHPEASYQSREKDETEASVFLGSYDRLF